jgi:hypothetical protein
MTYNINISVACCACQLSVNVMLRSKTQEDRRKVDQLATLCENMLLISIYRNINQIHAVMYVVRMRFQIFRLVFEYIKIRCQQ